MTKKKENETRLQQLKNIVASLPEKPGSYQYYDAEGTIIYVGKAKNLKRRVSSYFNKEQQSAKTTMLVSKIHNIKYIVVNTEEDALLLENNLIKQYKPKYNVLLKDDKTYPSICITKEDYPRIYKTRQINLKHGQYFGPYSHVGTMYTLLDLIKAMYFPRPCMMPMNETGVKEGKYEICLNYQIKKCKAPCIGKQSREEYNENIDECREILKGNTDNVLNKMKQRMEELAGMMRFEEAQIIKERFDMLRSFQAKSEIVHPSNTNLDVFNIETDEKNAFINYLHVIRGSITLPTEVIAVMQIILILTTNWYKPTTKPDPQKPISNISIWPYMPDEIFDTAKEIIGLICRRKSSFPHCLKSTYFLSLMILKMLDVYAPTTTTIPYPK